MKRSWCASCAAAIALAAPASSRAAAYFSHEVHAVNHEVACKACHRLQRDGFPAADPKACADCHEKTPAYAFERAPRIGIAFPHAIHEARGYRCQECHTSFPEPGRKPEPLFRRADCAACHAREGARTAERDCAICHGVDYRRVPPRDHAKSWLIRHGQESQSRVFDQHGRDCRMCHGADACDACHRSRLPRSHTGLWRVRLHGTAASWDRDSCKTCHETGVCIGCHRTTRPLNHTASWRSTHGLAAQTTGNETCRACHTANDCTRCHRPGLTGF